MRVPKDCLVETPDSLVLVNLKQEHMGEFAARYDPRAVHALHARFAWTR